MKTASEFNYLGRIFLLLIILSAMLPPAISKASDKNESATRIVLLGTGNPQPDPDRAGSATAIIVNQTAYLVDFGPGVVRRAAAALRDKGIRELYPPKIRVVFNTHLHSDHTVGYADLILTPWTMGRRVPLEVYGPPGLKEMTEHLLAAYKEDIRIRTEGLEAIPKESLQVNVHLVKPGVVYQDDNVKVTAFPTSHGDWEHSFGYRFDTADRSIVIPGDTTPTQATIDACNGCDILIHEALTMKFVNNSRRPNPQGFDLKKYAATYHTTTSQLAELANKAKPGLLILHHNPISLRPDKRPMASTPADLLNEITTAGYKGKVVVGHDLDVY
ncbi:MAG: MBL fold metallo-hydrolase [Proteobacteria bacterium]|nr:MBL fold metallo-hydrolase [Pseudomonadota bacterium]MBU1715978.1 MBL fold metallo-hydrolase [Pseudomonadota bacterium]